MEHKFKTGDVVRVSDQNDPAYRMNNLYEIVGFNENWKHYDIRSFSGGYIKNVAEAVLGLDLPLENVSYFEQYYRLATPAEIALYGRKKIQENT